MKTVKTLCVIPRENIFVAAANKRGRLLWDAMGSIQMKIILNKI